MTDAERLIDHLKGMLVLMKGVPPGKGWDVEEAARHLQIALDIIQQQAEEIARLKGALAMIESHETKVAEDGVSYKSMAGFIAGVATRAVLGETSSAK